MLFVSKASGMANFTGHIASCLSPFIAEMNEPMPFYWIICLLSLAFVASFFVSEMN